MEGEAGIGKSTLLAAVRDVTERKRAEETLRQSEERHRAVFERTTDGIFLADFDSMRILESNAALQGFLGYTAEELEGKSLQGFRGPHLFPSQPALRLHLYLLLL